MSYEDEFETVGLLERSMAETRGVDAFALSLIKAERQIRKLFTYLVFQFPAFSVSNVADFRGVLAQNKNVYFEGFIAGIDALYPKPVKSLVGSEFDHFVAVLQLAIDFRNKIFHGQLTTEYLSREKLLDLAATIRAWCKTLAAGTEAEFSYDGFGRNSLRKHRTPVWETYRVSITSLDEYRAFIRKHVQR